MPARTPKDVVDRVNREVNSLLQTPAMQSAIHDQGAEPKAMTPEQFGALLQKDYSDSKNVVARTGMKIE
jgi:tripartite-type tricarboxylate transporter receptor subunit TctC